MTMRKSQVPFAWPPRCHLNFYVLEKDGLRLYDSSTYRFFDLDDIVDEMLWGKKSGTIYFGLSGNSKKWPTWDEHRLQHMEWLIDYDLTFDREFRVKITRETEDQNLPCTEEFLWKLMIKRTN